MKTPTPKQIEMMQQAMTLHESGQLNKAAAQYKKLLTLLPNNTTLLTNLGAIALQQGNLEEGVKITAKSLKIAPNQPYALNNCGVALKALKRFDEALASYDQAIAFNPNYSEAYLNRGNILQELNRFDEAFSSYIRAVELNPNYPEAYTNCGTALQELKRLDEALACYDRAIALNPNYADAYARRGNLLQKLRHFDEALASYDRAIVLNPNYAEAHANRGAALQELKRFDQALTSYDRAIAINSSYAHAYSNRGVALQSLKRLDEALASFDRAVALNPSYAEAYSNRGLALQELSRFDEALASYDCAVTLNPNYAEAYANRGTALQELKRFDEALASYGLAVNLNPNYAEAYANRGTALQELKRFEEALASYNRAITLEPNLNFLYGQRLHVKMQICDWCGIETEFALLAEKIQAGEKISPPFELLGISGSAQLQRKAAEVWIANKFPAMNVLPKISRYPEHGKIRVGYFSADFRCHPVAFLTAELFEKHDRSIFEITAFAFGSDRKDEMRSRLELAFDHFVDVRNLSDKEVAQLSRNMEIDIAVDLGGHTINSRPGIFAMRAAPLQVSYIGYLGTMGADYMDYLIADPVIVPEQAQQHYVEKIVYLPSYQANDSKRRIADTIFTREQLGLPEKGFVFCSFNNSFKITPESFSSWMRILNAVENSVLLLLADNESVERNLKNAAVLRDVAADRLIFGKRMSLPDYLARYRTADLFLDTRPYNAGTTASDALWAGLPVLTCMGEAFASRVAASLLTAIGLPELITTTQQQYEALAIELATHSIKLAAIKEKLAQNRLTTPLFDIQLFTDNIENAYIQMYQRYRASLPLKHILP